MIKNIIKNYIGNAGTNNEIGRELWVKEALSRLPHGGAMK